MSGEGVAYCASLMRNGVKSYIYPHGITYGFREAELLLWPLLFFTPLHIYTIEELKWDILILRWRGIGNDLK
jgi:hypothetical protein